jgi:hypothetical protein
MKYTNQFYDCIGRGDVMQLLDGLNCSKIINILLYISFTGRSNHHAFFYNKKMPSHIPLQRAKTTTGHVYRAEGRTTVPDRL